MAGGPGDGRDGSQALGHPDPRAALSAEDVASLSAALDSAVATFMERDRRPANLVGFGAGVKRTGDQPTGEKALVAMVQHKVSPDTLAQADLLPTSHEGVALDVVDVGQVFAGVGLAPLPPAPPAAEQPAPDRKVAAAPTPAGGSGLPALLNTHLRPAPGGWSVGHFAITAGTIGTCVYDILPGGSVHPPRPGLGMPLPFYILSNNHVLAHSNGAKIGDPILQPGPADNGLFPGDQIAILSRFVPIEFNPPVPLNQQRNLVDCAVAAADLRDIDREIFWIGEVRGWRRKARVLPGATVYKTGRTSGWTTERILAVNVTIDVNYPIGNALFVARFRDQIVTPRMSAGGDSGSLVLTDDNVAVGLLFAGSNRITVCNQIENVRSLLGVEVAQRIL